MFRLVIELRTENFLTAHPVLQSAYAHYAVVAIHPFADGNGRVARALASVFTYRALSIPFLVLAGHKGAYLDALGTADQGNFQPFVDFTLDRGLDAMQLVEESIRAAAAPPTDESLNTLKALYVTKGGYTHEQVDQAGVELFNAVVKETQQQIQSINTSAEIRMLLGLQQGSMKLLPNYRGPLQGGQNCFVLSLIASAPVNTTLHRTFSFLVPKDCGREDDLVLIDDQSRVIFSARIGDVMPSLSSVLQMRIRMFAEGLLSRSLAELATMAHENYRKP